MFCFKNFRQRLNLRYISSLVQSKAYINGKWVKAENNEVFEIINPANGSVVGSVPNMSVNDASQAVQAAKKAFESSQWSMFTAKERSSLLKKWYCLIEENADEISSIMTAESGKPLNEARGEVAYGNAFIEWFGEEARRIYGEIIPSSTKDRELIVLKEPLGVAALITPWNFPMAMITRKAGAALAAGLIYIFTNNTLKYSLIWQELGL
ncbi:glutarate-semialdehyde dehydrogenase-like isoform X1 [Rhagoletis pomonella]|uniref:glutarate-semialdehyde dehydrogenase-like isoform X1 n=2 Tax=Rhagoletis pomonella TaxID=28610 RepID=UPI001782AE90|nr:glutarate-semialdehyde dehydrogenase-like isoform X1 [Rhagoletis pomonella]